MTAMQKYSLSLVKIFQYLKDNDMDEVKERMKELFKPIDQQIMMCDDGNEVMMLACVMLQSARDILDSQLGPAGRKKIFKDCV